jgi:Tol biopolymer transport system component
MSPSWSPDGRYIAFERGTGADKGFYIVPALGGAERKVADVYEWNQQGTRSQVVDWSPDGKTLAVSDKTTEDEPWSIFLISVETNERRRLTQPAAAYNGDNFATFSPDGSRLAFVRSRAGAGDIYTVAITGGEPVRITSDGAVVLGLAWTPDGTELVFSSDRGGGNSTLWRVSAAGGTPAPVASAGENVSELSIARQGNRLAYAKPSVDVNIYRMELTGPPGGRHMAGQPASFIASTRIENNPHISPDGRRVAFTSDRSGSDEVWSCDADGKTPVQLTNLGSVHSHGLSWAPDGRFITFSALVNGNADIYIVSAEGGNPRRLTTDPSTEIEPAWSRDGQWIYFVSNRTGRGEVWKMPAAGGPAVQLTNAGATNPVEAADSRSVYVIKGAAQRLRRSEPGLWQVPTEGGEETRVLAANVDPGNWAVMAGGIYYLTRQPGQSLYTVEFFDFATRQTAQITTLDGPRGTFLISGLTVAPDEHSILYAQRDKLDYDLMLVENFH